jgi:hypothetical protein
VALPWSIARHKATAPAVTIQSTTATATAIATGSDGGESGGGEFLRVDVPVAEVAGDFRCEAVMGRVDSMARAARTDVRVLSRGWYQGRPVSKLLLSPLTGRRHQLRLHCLVLGCPIVGDWTYGSEARADGKANAATAERMMLHAHSLCVPRPRGKVRSGGVGAGAGAGEVLVQAVAPDPFVGLLKDEQVA